MTIINSEYELQEKINKAEIDIVMGRVRSFEEVCFSLNNEELEVKKEKVCMI